MVKLYRSNTESIEDSDIIVIGFPDESKSHAKRKGTSKGPEVLRNISNESEFFERDGKLIPTCPMSGTFERKCIFDAGNISNRQELRRTVFGVVSRGKLPIIIGGDHSLTTETIKAASKAIRKNKISLLYFDAHPDFVSSARNYYGSVLTDLTQALNFRKSMLVGTRAAEPEELRNARTADLKIVNPLDIAELGVKNVAEMIRERTSGSEVYISVDLDCVDPAFAPGVSVPSPGGLSSIDLIYLLHKAVETTNVVGIDIVELSPDYDINGITAMLAARIMSECIASI